MQKWRYKNRFCYCTTVLITGRPTRKRCLHLHSRNSTSLPRKSGNNPFYAQRSHLKYCIHCGCSWEIKVQLQFGKTDLCTSASRKRKYHNRAVNNQNGVSTTATKNDSKAETSTELQEFTKGVQQHGHNNNVNNNNFAKAREKAAGNSSPFPQQTVKKHIFGSSTATKSKQQLTRKEHFQTQSQRSLEDSTTKSTSSAIEDGKEFAQYKLLNRHSCNGRLDYAALEKHLQEVQTIKTTQDKSVEVLGVLLQYLVYDLDAFACPTAKKESTKSNEKLKKTVHLLDEAKNFCSQLQGQISDREKYFTEREEKYRCELEKIQENFSEFQILAKKKISECESNLAAKDVEYKSALETYAAEMEAKFADKEKKLLDAEQREQILQARLNALENSALEMREKFTNTENSCAAHMDNASLRELELKDRLKTLTLELEKMRTVKEAKERELHEKLNLSQEEIAVLRTSPRNSRQSISSNASTDVSLLQNETESLRCVLELKQKEISKLSKHNEELIRDADERATLHAKISVLDSSCEMLKSKLEMQQEKEKDLLRQIDDIQKAFKHENTKRTRLAYDNEALQWQLKQRSEQLHIVEMKLYKTSGQDSINSSNASFLRSPLTSTQIEDVSPPASPIIKGVIEKNAAVSWVLEMDDETPEAAATKMVKRAGSLRSIERSPLARRQLSANAAVHTNNSSSNVTPNKKSGLNPLSQSMSATSVICQHSNEASTDMPNRSHSRIRSKSMCIKSTEPISTESNTRSSTLKKGTRPKTVCNSRKSESTPSTLDAAVNTSLSYGIRPRTSTMKAGVNLKSEDETLFESAPSSYKLITCDASALGFTLNSGERLELHTLPSHTSVHDLKLLNNFQEIQESAGEAMVSGTNSEDEACSASSEEVITSASTSSRKGGSNSSLNQMKNSQISLEDEFYLEKVSSLNGTPMEMSWSDDVEVFNMPNTTNTTA